MTIGVTGTLSSRGFEAVQNESNRLRASRAVVGAIVLGTGNDKLLVQDFAPRHIDISDKGGNDQYRILMGNASSALPTGTISINDQNGPFDEVVLEQTNARNPLTLDSFKVTNGREVVNYSAGVERLTLLGKGGAFDPAGISSLFR